LTENKREKELVPDFCPHCGKELTPWEKVLLSVDRALMCRNCWYRIILKPVLFEDNERKSKSEKDS
jgi:DNA-directed RNA polymerase subunit RPC12/RpoP